MKTKQRRRANVQIGQSGKIHACAFQVQHGYSDGSIVLLISAPTRDRKSEVIFSLPEKAAVQLICDIAAGVASNSPSSSPRKKQAK